MDTHQVLTINEVAERTTLSVAGVYQLIRERKLRAVKIGKRTVVRGDDFEAFLDNLPEAR